jgi:hypothetical protein
LARVVVGTMTTRIKKISLAMVDEVIMLQDAYFYVEICTCSLLPSKYTLSQDLPGNSPNFLNARLGFPQSLPVSITIILLRQLGHSIDFFHPRS